MEEQKNQYRISFKFNQEQYYISYNSSIDYTKETIERMKLDDIQLQIKSFFKREKKDVESPIQISDITLQKTMWNGKECGIFVYSRLDPLTMSL